MDPEFLKLIVGRQPVNGNPNRQGNKISKCLSCDKLCEGEEWSAVTYNKDDLDWVAREGVSAGVTSTLTHEG